MSPAAGSSVLPLALLDGEPSFERLVRVAAQGGALAAGGLWGSSQAYVLAALTRRAQGPWAVSYTHLTLPTTSRV